MTTTERYADALIKVVAMEWGEWPYPDGSVGCYSCPACGLCISHGDHRDDCIWIAAARALEVLP